MLRRRKRKKNAMKRMFCTCMCVDRWVDGKISMTYEAKEKSAQ